MDLQREALLKAGADVLVEEKASGKNTKRSELQKMMAKLRPGDVVMVWKLDRLGRSTKDLISLIEMFRESDVDFISLQEKLDTTSATGEMLFTIMAALSQFERSMIVERTMAGLEVARKRGRIGGRPPVLSESQKKAAFAMRSHLSIRKIAATLGCSKSTIHNLLVNAD